MIAGPVAARVHAAVAGVLAQTPAPPPGDPAAGRGEEFGKTSPLALVVILLLALATILLIRSMNKRLRNVPASFDSDGAGEIGPDDRPADDESPEDRPGPDTPNDRDHSPGGTSTYDRTERPPRADSP